MASPEDTMILDTTKGTVVIAMRPDLAPKHVARIKELVRKGFYDGVAFHRVIEGFMAQTGCPYGTGTGGSGQKLKAEFNKEPHVRGTVSMARASDPDSGDSQFFICFDDASFLDGQYTAWGNVIEGMENVDKIKRGEPVRDGDKIIKARMGSDADAQVRHDARHRDGGRYALHITAFHQGNLIETIKVFSHAVGTSSMPRFACMTATVVKALGRRNIS